MRNTTSILATLLLAACGTAVDSDAVLVSDDDAFGKLGGLVVDSDGSPVAGVTVTAQGLSATTDGDGVYLIDGLEPGTGEFSVEFSKRGYAKGYTRANLISWETAAANKTLLPVNGVDTFDASTGGTIEVEVYDGRRMTVEFDGGSIVDSSGNPYTGVVSVEVTYVNPYDGKLAAGAPGDLQALAYPEDSASKEASEPTQLVSYGMADITLYPEDCDEGDTECEEENLNLAEGTSALVNMPIFNPEASIYEVFGGEEMPSWSYNPERGLWQEEGSGGIGSGDDGLSFEFEATHFSWWNCDQGFVPTFACGRVVDYLGFPVRSAEVLARGSQTNSIAYTDEDGFYTITVMAGDTVTFSASTYVAGTTNWPVQEQVMFIDGGDSRSTCAGDEVPDMPIEVCRESGVVMTDNITSHLSVTDATNGDRLRAFFWEAPGDIEYCQNPWDNIDMESCEILNTGDYATHDISDADGLPLDLRPVGDWLEISNGRDVYTLEKEVSNGKPFYTFETESFNENSSDYLETNDIDLRGGDVLSALAPGDSSIGMGSINESNWVTIPAEFTSNGMSGPTTMSSSSGTTINFSAANNSDGILVFGASVEQSTEVDDSSDFMVCRFNDDGSITIPGDVMGAIDNGVSGLSVFRPEIGWTPGPDGLPIRIQAFSGTSIEVDMQ